MFNSGREDATYCRVCLGRKGAGTSINEYITRTDTLYTALCRLCPAAFNEKANSGWSANVCKTCRRHIIVAQDLYELCLRSTERLEQLDKLEAKKNNSDEEEDEFDAVFFATPKDAVSVVSTPNENPPDDDPTKDQKKDAAPEQDDEFDPDFFGTPEDLVAAAENAAAKTCIEIGGDTIALVNLEHLLSATKQKPTTSGTIASSSVDGLTTPVVDGSVRNTSSIGLNIPPSGVVENTETTDTADVEMDFAGGTGFSSDESEDELAKIFSEEFYDCTERCGMYFFDKPSLDNHLMDHKMRRRWFCKFCFEGFNTQALLCDHLASHDRSLLCEVCGELTDTPEDNNHNHSKEGPFDCPKCPRQFPTQLRLGVHMKTHGAKQYCCDECGLYLSSAKRLRNHKASKHSGEKPFSCDICGLRFAIKDSIKGHMWTHTGQKRYACAFCDRRYGNGNDLKDHLKKHLGVNIYQCDQCDASYRLIKELKEHYEQVHYKDGASTCERRPDFRFTLAYLVNLRKQRELDKQSASEDNSSEQAS